MCRLSRLSLPSVAVLIGIGCLAASPARADVITQSFSFPAPIDGTDSIDGPNLSEFDPSQGTLNSITFSVSATATFSGGPENVINKVTYAISFEGEGSKVFTIGVIMGGNGSATATGGSTNDTNVSDLNNFIGTQGVSTSAQVLIQSIEGAVTFPALVSTFENESLVYNYTPFATAPEPTSIAVLSVGLLGLGWTMRRNRSAR